jgi:hypothetical protein
MSDLLRSDLSSAKQELVVTHTATSQQRLQKSASMKKIQVILPE